MRWDRVLEALKDCEGVGYLEDGDDELLYILGEYALKRGRYPLPVSRYTALKDFFEIWIGAPGFGELLDTGDNYPRGGSPRGRRDHLIDWVAKQLENEKL